MPRDVSQAQVSVSFRGQTSQQTDMVGEGIVGK